MKLKGDTYDQQRENTYMTIGCRFIAALMILCGLAVSSAFGQMGSSVTYSDAWLDDSNPDASRVVGSGLTTDSYNAYGHRYWVNSSITSPKGRTTSATSYTSASYARADISLAWDWEDMGEYTVNTTHSMTCPYMYGIISSGTSAKGVAGYSRLCYRYDHYDSSLINPYVYKILEGCGERVSCWNTYAYWIHSLGMRASTRQPWFKPPFLNYRQCTYVHHPLLPSSCDVNYCIDVDVISVDDPGE